jgi:hypothetical protein
LQAQWSRNDELQERGQEQVDHAVRQRESSDREAGSEQAPVEGEPDEVVGRM